MLGIGWNDEGTAGGPGGLGGGRRLDAKDAWTQASGTFCSKLHSMSVGGAKMGVCFVGLLGPVPTHMRVK